MSISIILLGILPLLIFVIIDSLFGMKKALIGALFAVALEAIISLYLFKTIDEVTITNFLLIIVFAIVSLRLKDPKYFKLQPTILSSLVALYLLITYMIGKPILFELFIKYKSTMVDLIAENPTAANMMDHPIMGEIFKIGTLTMGIAHLAHALLTCWAALRLSNWWWFFMRLSIWPLSFIGIIWASFMAKSTMGL